jgi:SulP family sulfate permease
VSAAVGIGVALSLLLNVNQEAQDVRLVRIREGANGEFVEEPAPATLESNTVVVLNAYGSLFYAGARTLEASLPAVGDADRPVVVLRIRGRTMLGATAFSVISRYASSLDERGGRLYLSGVDPDLVSQFHASGRVNATPITLMEAQPALGESTRLAIADAQAFLIAEAAPAPAEETVPSYATRTIGFFKNLGKR